MIADKSRGLFPIAFLATGATSNRHALHCSLLLLSIIAAAILSLPVGCKEKKDDAEAKADMPKAAEKAKPEFPFNLPEITYIGRTEAEIKQAFPAASYQTMDEPYKWNASPNAPLLSFDGYFQNGTCTTSGCYGNCWRTCLLLIMKNKKCVAIKYTPGLWVNPNGGTPWGSQLFGKYLKKSLMDLTLVFQTWEYFGAPPNWDSGQMDFDTGEKRVLFNLLGPRDGKNPEGFKQFETVEYVVAEKASFPK